MVSSWKLDLFDTEWSYLQMFTTFYKSYQSFAVHLTSPVWTLGGLSSRIRSRLARLLALSSQRGCLICSIMASCGMLLCVGLVWTDQKIPPSTVTQQLCVCVCVCVFVFFFADT
jgi:hypothetical protein